MISGAPRPNRLDEVKDEDYHCRWGRFILQTATSDQTLIMNAFKYHVNWNFYKGNQWIYNEDLEVFLKDTTGGIRNRVRWVYNQIMPQVHSYIGTVADSSYLVRAYNTNPDISRIKEQERRKRIAAFQLAQAYPQIADQLAARYDLGETVDETEQNFENTWVDYSTIAMNALFRHQERLNNFAELKEDAAETMCLGGLNVLYRFFRGTEMYWAPIDNKVFIYDTRARRKNMSDAEFMGHIELPVATELYEQYPNIGVEAMAAIERALKLQRPVANINRDYQYMFGADIQGCIPKYNLYWHDTEKQQWGFVDDGEYGICEHQLLPKDYRDPDTGEPAKYTVDMAIKKADLPAENQKAQVENNGIRTKYVDMIRFIEFTPRELIGTEKDIVYNYGLMPFQEVYYDQPFESAMPYKIATYIYRMGELVAPVDGSIDVQRMLNRFLSMAEAQMNNARGANVFYDKNMMADEKDGEFALLDKMNNSKPIGVDASRYGGNLQNAVIPYNGGEAIAGASGMMTIIERLRLFNQNMTGVTDNVQGLSGPDTPVGVNEQNIAQSNRTQRKFYTAISRQFLDIYKTIANSGRRFYCLNEYEFTDLIGEEAFQQIRLTSDMVADRFHVELRIASADEVSIAANNERLIALYSIGLQNPSMAIIGKEEFAKLYNNAETDQVADAIRAYMRKADAAALQYEKEQKQTQQQQVAMAQQQDQDNKQHELDKIMLQGQMKGQTQRMVGVNKIILSNMSGKTALQKELIKANSQRQPAP